LIPEPISVAGLLVSALLPWLLGASLVYWLLSKSGRYNAFIVIGQGYIVGLFLTTLVMRVVDGLGIPLHFWGIAAMLLVFTLLSLATIRLQAPVPRSVQAPDPLAAWQIGVISILVVLIAYRYNTLLQELLLRPLYAWDAWMNWAPKAIVWHHNMALTPFISPTAWLSQAADVHAYTLGNWAAWRYPDTVPLIQLWGMAGAGSSGHPGVYLPWVLVILSLGLALYGHLRLLGATALVACTASYALLNLPFINVHSVLAGYADLWLASSFGLASFALHEWKLHRHWTYGLLVIFLALVCTQLKVPGLILGAILMLVFLESFVSLPTRKKAALYLTLAALSIGAVLVGIDLDLPSLGRVSVNSDNITLPYIGSFNIEYHSTEGAFFESLFSMLNWNLLFYLILALLITQTLRGNLFRSPSPDLSCAILAFAFIFFVFHFTGHYVNAIAFTNVNRAMLYTVPPLIFFLFRNLIFKQPAQYICSQNHGYKKTETTRGRQ
jgi:hypothetical protein